MIVFFVFLFRSSKSSRLRSDIMRLTALRIVPISMAPSPKTAKSGIKNSESMPRDTAARMKKITLKTS